jgi:hypothetical protein
VTDVFISYSRKDSEFVKVLDRVLQESHRDTVWSWDMADLMVKGCAWIQDYLKNPADEDNAIVEICSRHREPPAK